MRYLILAFAIAAFITLWNSGLGRLIRRWLPRSSFDARNPYCGIDPRLQRRHPSQRLKGRHDD